MNASVPKVSVGMPVYNGEQYLRSAIDSILNQTLTDLELVIFDNASTDGTQQVCEQYANSDNRVRYYRNDKNIGASDNYNNVFLRSRGKYFKWASSNDYCHKEFLARCVESLEAHSDAVLSYPRAKLFEEELDDAKAYEDNLDLRDKSACARYKMFMKNIRLNNVMNGVVRSDALRKTNLIKTFFSSDVNLMAELVLYGEFIEVPEYLFYRRMEPKTATKLKSAKEVLRHYDPKLENPMLFQTWKIKFADLGAVRKASLPINEKACLYSRIIRQIVWARGSLFRDVWAAARWWLLRKKVWK